MLVVLIAIAYYLTGSRRRESSRLAGTFLQPDEPEASIFDRLVNLMNRPIGWTLIFVLVAGISLGTAILFVHENAVPAESMVLVFGAMLGLSLLGFLWYGVYRTLRIRGHSSAVSTFESAVIVGLLAIVAVAGHLAFLS